MLRGAFTLVELIFVIVIIGVLAAVATPKFKDFLGNSKISAELATASSVQSAIDSAHGEWVTSSCSDFLWGNGQKGNDASPGGFNANGYPNSLTNSTLFDRIFKNKTTDWTQMSSCPSPTDANQTCYTGPATRTDGKGVKDRNVLNKPEGNDYWDYNATNGTFNLVEP